MSRPRFVALCALLSVLYLFIPVGAALAKAVYFQPGATAASVSDQIRGYDTRVYEVTIAPGQRLTVDLKSKNSSLYFRIYGPGTAPGRATAMFDAALQDMPYSGGVLQSGTYSVEVYLTRNAARRAEWATYRVDVVRSPVAARAAVPVSPWSRPPARPPAANIARSPYSAPVVSVAPLTVARPRLRPFPAPRYDRPIVETPPIRFSTPPAPRPRHLLTAVAPYPAVPEDLALPCKPGPGKVTQKCAFNLSQVAGSAVIRVVLPDGRMRAFRLSEEGNASTVGDTAFPLQVVKEDGLVTVIPAPGERIEVPQAVLRR